MLAIEICGDVVRNDKGSVSIYWNNEQFSCILYTGETSICVVKNNRLSVYMKTPQGQTAGESSFSTFH